MHHPQPSPWAIVLAAGKGTRMGTDLPKPLVPLQGKPILNHLLDAFEKAGVNKVVVVVGHEGEMVAKQVHPDVSIAWQYDRLGTAHAVACALPKVSEEALEVFVFVGDSPLISAATIQHLLHHHQSSGAACTFLSATFARHLPYARVVIDEEGNLLRCVEERDTTPEEFPIREYLSSHFIFKTSELTRLIKEVKPHPQTGERYLTDMIDLLMQEGKKVEVCFIGNFQELIGLNTPEDLAWADSYLAAKK